MFAGGVVNHNHSGDFAVERIAGDMGRGNINKPKKFAIDIRLIFPDIENDCSKFFILYSGLECGSIVNGPATGIYEDTAGFERGEKFIIRQMVCFILSFASQRRMQRDKIAT